MSWAEQKAREIAGHWSSDDFGGDATDPLVLRAIRETIEHCAQVAERHIIYAPNEDFMMGADIAKQGAARVIRKLGGP